MIGKDECAHSVSYKRFCQACDNEFQEQNVQAPESPADHMEQVEKYARVDTDSYLVALADLKSARNPDDAKYARLLAYMEPEAGAPPTAFTKHDSGKPRISRLPWAALEEGCEVLAHGAAKYGWDNWKAGGKEAVERYLDALGRHYSAVCRGETHDKDSQMRHLAHILANVLFLMELTRD